MNPNFTFDAEGVFDQQIKPLRPRKRRTQRWRRWWIALTKGDTLDTRAIKQTMRCPKLLAASMPRVILQEEFLQRPRSAESEFGLRFQPPQLQTVERRLGERRQEARRQSQRRKERRQTNSPLYLAYPILDRRGRRYDDDFLRSTCPLQTERRLVRRRSLKRRVFDRRLGIGGFGKEDAIERFAQESCKHRRVKSFEPTVDLAPRKGRKRTSVVVPVPGVFDAPLFTPSKKAARELRDKDVSLFKKIKS